MDSFEEFTVDVEKVNGVPVVVARYGFKKVEIGGRKYLAPMSMEELTALRAELEGSSPDDPKPLPDAHCNTGSAGMCYPMSGCRRCEFKYSPHGSYCICIAD